VSDPHPGPCLSCVALRDQIAALREELARLQQEKRHDQRVWLEIVRHFSRQHTGPKEAREEERDRQIVRLRDDDAKVWTWAKLGAQCDPPISGDAARKAYDRRRQEIISFLGIMEEAIGYISPEHREAFHKRVVCEARKMAGMDPE
jgi:hypothetical protein